MLQAVQPAFGRKTDAKEFNLLKAAIKVKVSATEAQQVKQDLCMAFSKDAEDLETFQQMNLMAKIAFGKEMSDDMRRIATELKSLGLPKETTPILFLIKTRTAQKLDLKHFSFSNMMTEVIKVIKSLPAFLTTWADEIKQMDTSKLTKSAIKPTPQEVRDATQKVIDKKIPVQEMVLLMKLLFDQAEDKDLIQVSPNYYALRLYIPGEPMPSNQPNNQSGSNTSGGSGSTPQSSTPPAKP
jgi:hypothetical protein